MFGLGAVAIAHPVLEVVGRAPGFLVAHAIDGGGLVVFVGLLLVIPALLAALVVGVPALGGGVVGLLVALIAQHVGVRLGLDLAPALVTSLTAGPLAAVGYRRSAAIRQTAVWLGWSVVPVVAIFGLALPPALVSQGPERGPVGEGSGRSDLIVLILDELPTASIMDSRGDLDATRLPGLGQLAADGVWYRDAVTVETGTARSVPAILTGRRGQADALPVAGDYPDTLMALLAATHRVVAVEEVTRLCPASICSARGERPDWGSLTRDVTRIFVHAILPPAQADRLVPIGHVWRGFGDDEHGFEMEAALEEARGRDRRVTVEGFLDEVAAAPAGPLLGVAHWMLPHRPWALLPDGTTYRAPWPPGYGLRGWGPDGFFVADGWRRHLLQLAYVDDAIARMVEVLKAAGRYDDALIVVVADHGVAFLPDLADMRSTNPTTAASILPVPLLIKFPHGVAAAPVPGTVVDSRVTTLDIVPTLIEVLGIERRSDLPALAGRSLLVPESAPAGTTIELRGQPFLYPAGVEPVVEIARRRLRWLPEGHGTVGPEPSRAEGKARGEMLEVRMEGPLVTGPAPDEGLLVGIFAGDELVGLTRSYRQEEGIPVYSHILYPAPRGVVTAYVLEGG